MAANLSVWLLGGLRIEADGEPVADEAWRRTRAKAVVKLLALAPRHRLHREQLMDALWPDLAPDAGAANVRKALHYARRSLGADHLRQRDEVVSLEAEHLWVDVDAFRRAVAARDEAAADALYTGDLLIDDRFEPWAEGAREELRLQLARLLVERAAELDASGEQRGAVRLLERCVAVDPLDEDAHLALVRLHARGGQRHLALRHYRRLETQLRADLDVEPSALARALYEDVVADRVPVDARIVLPEPIEIPTATPDERRLVTVVALELPGRAPPSALTEMCEIVGAAGGAVERDGDGRSAVGVFGRPKVHEDDAVRAVAAALALVTRSARPVRVGVETGEVVGSADATLGAASKLCRAARPDTVLVGERAWRITRGAFLFADPARDEPTARRALAPLPPALPPGVPGESPFVGRAPELDAVARLFDDVVASGRPCLVLVLGPAGIGKSRLAREAVAVARARHPQARVLRGRCLAVEQGVSYWALGEVLRDACDIRLADSSETAAAKLVTAAGEILERGGVAAADVASTTFALAATASIALPGNPLADAGTPAVADELRRAWPRFASAFAAIEPAIWVVEDLHWGTEPLFELLERIVARGERPFMVLATARPEVLEARPELGGGIEGSSAVGLRPLTDADSRTLLANLTSARGLDETRQEEVLARAEGNPFFLEQTALHLAEGAPGAVPDTLYALLAARIDGLPAVQKRVVQEAAVLGRVFWAGALAAALPGTDVSGALLGLERRGVVSLGIESSLPGHSEYAFRHALLRDVAYESLPPARRARAHAGASAWLEAVAADRVDELIEVIAYHDLEAIRGLVDDAGADRHGLRLRAFEHVLVASAARRRSAPATALQLDEEALTLASTDAERLRALEALGDDCEAALRGDDAQRHYESALALAREGGRPADVARLCAKLAGTMAMSPGIFSTSPDPEDVDRLVAEGLAVAPDRVSEARLLVVHGASARLWRGSEPFGQGVHMDPAPIDDRIRAVESALDVGRAEGLNDLAASAEAALGILFGIAGRHGEALGLARRGLDRLGVARGRQEAAELLRVAAVRTVMVAADFEEGLALARRCHALSEDAYPHQRMHATWPFLVALYHLGRWDELLSVADEHITAFTEEPAVGCHFVRDGPVVAATVLAHRGDVGAARALAALPGDPLDDPREASAWQSWFALVIGEPHTAVAISADKTFEGRTYGPHHAVALVEALVALGSWSRLDDVLPFARASAAGNALLGPICDRAEGLREAARGRRARAAALLRRARKGFVSLQVPFEVARTEEALAGLVPDGPDATRRLEAALAAYERTGATPRAVAVRGALDAAGTRP